CVFVLMIRRPQRSPLLPYTTLFRSSVVCVCVCVTLKLCQPPHPSTPSHTLRSEEHTSELPVTLEYRMPSSASHKNTFSIYSLSMARLASCAPAAPPVCTS